MPSVIAVEPVLPPTQSDLTGQRFNRLVALKYVGRDKNKVTLWLCVCVCGNELIVRRSGLITGHSKSCGCWKIERMQTVSNAHKHGHATKGTSPTYNSWAAMIQRTQDPSATSCPRYGGRGITVCEDWKSFKNFLRDMGERPKGTSIDRIDNSLGYFKENCRWADATTQTANRRPRKKLCQSVGLGYIVPQEVLESHA
jgi:hypothetical protein